MYLFFKGLLIWKSKKVEVIFQNVDKDPKKKNARRGA